MQPAAIVLVSERDAFAAHLPAQRDLRLIRIRAAGHYMNTLIETRAALVLIDAEHPHWRRFASVPKASAATRRIPLVVVGDDAERLADAAAVGADLTLGWAQLGAEIARLLADWARIPDPQMLKQLDCECGQPLPPLAREGLREFNAGEYYRQHDLFEAQWDATAGPVRDLYRAALQVGVAYFQIERGNYRGALKMLQRSVQWLLLLPDVCQGIDVAQLRRDSYAVRAELERLGAGRLSEFDRALLKPLRCVDAD